MWSAEAQICEIRGFGLPVADRLFNAVTLPYTLSALAVLAVVLMGYTPLFPISRILLGTMEEEEGGMEGEGAGEVAALEVPNWNTAVKTNAFGSYPSNYSIFDQVRLECVCVLGGLGGTDVASFARLHVKGTNARPFMP